MENRSAYRPVKELPPEVARKIAAGEVIDRPAAVVRELLDNAIDSGASRISVEISGGGIETIRVTDNGCGMSAEDLALCTHTHTTSKIAAEDDLLSLSTLGFRGEALSSIQAVSRLEIATTRDGREAWKLELGKVVPSRLPAGTVVRIDGLFENFPARRQFLKRASAETALCRQIFTEKALPWPGIEFRLTVDGSPRMILSPAETLKERTLAALEPKESESFFYEISGSGPGFSFSAVLGSPDVVRADRRQLMVFVNGRRIMEYALLQAMEYGAEGHFPNGGHPFGCLFVTIDSALVDFNIHPAKREARFRDPGPLHHAVSSAIRDFYRRYSIASLAREADSGQSLIWPSETAENRARFSAIPAPSIPATQQDETRRDVQDTPALKPASWGGGYPARGRSAYPDTAVRIDDFSSESERSAQPGPGGERDFRYLGQVLGTFLAAERDGVFYLIDQHAAHERILYDELLSRRGDRQELLVPYRIETDGEVADRQLEESRGALEEAGFALENDGDGFWHITSVPARWTGTQKDLEGELSGVSVRPEALVSHLYATSACRAACKDGDILDEETARLLVARAFALPEPVCPHGRPLWIMMNRDELFLRIRRT